MVQSNTLLNLIEEGSDSYNYNKNKTAMLASIKDIGKFFVFIAGGLVAIIVGSFMIRGTMHMWDNPEKTDEKKKD